ncbi:MAG: tol-pal system YbgF family protein, partial [Nitrospinales bacterium]
SLEGKRALYLLGLIYREKEWHEKSIRSLIQALNEYKEIEDYIRLELANLYFDSRHYKQALRQVNALLENFPNTILYPQAELLRAETLKNLDQQSRAIELLNKTIQQISRHKDYVSFKPHLPELILKLADLHQSIQNNKEAYVLYRKLYLEYPVHEVMEFADPALERLSSQTLVVPPPLTLKDHARRIRGLLSGVRYGQAIKEINYLQLMSGNVPLPARFFFYLARAERGLRDRAKANQALNKFIDSYPNHPRVSEARYYIARNLWNLGEDRKSIEIFQRIIRDQPASEWAINAHFLMGRIYEENKQLALAVKHYRILVNRFKRHEHAQSAAWRLGWILNRKGEYKKAAERFQKNARLLKNGLYVENNLFWMAKAYEKAGMKEAARSAFSDLYADYPYTFYGLQAKVRLKELPAGNLAPLKKSGMEKIPVSLNVGHGNTPLNRGLTAQEKFHFARAQEMLAMGFSQNAEFEIRQIQRTIRKNLTGVLWVSEMYHRSKTHAGALRLLELYRSYKTKKKEKELPIKFWKYFYPLAYPQSIATYAGQYKVDPYL